MLDIVIMSKHEQKKAVKSEEEPNKLTQKQDLKSLFLAKKFRRSGSFSTKKIYGLTIDKLQEFIRVNHNLDLEQLVHAIKNEKLDALDVLDNFYTYLSEYKRPKDSKIGYAHGSIRTFLTISKEFLNNNGVKLYNEEVRQRLRLPLKEDNYEEGLSKEIINRVVRASSLRLSTVILIALSSGMRLGEIIQLRLSDINFETNPVTIQVRKETTKTRQTRFTQITAEATRSLKDYLGKSFSWKEDYKTDRFLFLEPHKEKIAKYKAQLNDPKTEKQRLHLIRKYIPKLENDLKTKSEEERYAVIVDYCKSSLEWSLRNIIKSIPDLAVKNKDNDRYQIHFHGLRSWFKSQVTDAHQQDFAEALMGHKSYRLKYYRQNHEKRQKEYRSVEHALTISDTEGIEKSLSQIQDREQELTELVKEMRQEHKEEMRTLRNWVMNVIEGYQDAKSR